MRNSLLVFLFALVSSFTYAQTGTVRGIVKNIDDGNGVDFAKVVILGTDKFAYTDGDGLFSIPGIPVGNYTIRVTAANFEEFKQDVELKKDEIVNLEIELGGKTLGVVNVDREALDKKVDPGTSVDKMGKEDIEKIPVSGGLPDFAGAIQTRPGIISTGDQGGQIYVRGGTPIQNKILLDGMTIYSPFHSIGFFSVFETDLIKSADIYTGGFNAKYGGRISSIMDISYRDGNSKRFSGAMGISPFTSNLLLEGPLTKSGNVSFVMSGKASVLEQTSQIFYPYINRDSIDTNDDGIMDKDTSYGLPFNFWDLYGKVTVHGQGPNKFSFFGFSFNDQVTYQAVSNLNWNSYGGGTNFIFVPNNSELFMRGRVNFSKYDIQLQEDLVDAQLRESGIFGAEMAFDFTYHLPGKDKLDYGFGFNYFATTFTTYNEVNREISQNDNTIEAGAYVSYRRVSKSKRLILEPSFRFQAYSSVGVVAPEPRFSAKFNITESVRIKGAAGYYTQNFTSTTSDKDVVNLFYGFITAPTNLPADFVQPDGEEVNVVNGLQRAWHGVGGLEIDLTDKLSVNVEGYYKHFSQLTNINRNKIYEDNVENSNVDDLYKKDFIIESGMAYGGDVVVSYSEGGLFLWGAYTFGKVLRWNGFEYYAPVFDRRHNLNLIGSYSFGKDQSWEANVRWNLGSGLPFKQTVGVFEQVNIDDIDDDYIASNANDLSFLYEDQNTGRLPYYHRLDINMKKTLRSKNYEHVRWEIIAGVTNVYSRENIFYVNRVTNERVHQLPIMPSAAVTFKF